jgi:SAM-dependent methyltransferase
MVRIEQRIETTPAAPDYANRKFSEREIAAGYHREFVGGMWDEVGQLQVSFLKEQGLRPTHRLIDIGAGAFRAGRHLVDYLDPGNYFAIDANLGLLESGYGIELSEEQRKRLPVSNLRANDRFDTDFGVQFDMAIAQSVFTHLSLNHLRLCLYRLAKSMRPGGRFYVTFFEERRTTPIDAVVRPNENSRPRFHERNVFWYYRDDLKWPASGLPWTYRYIGRWGHPRGQRMVEYMRSDAPLHASTTAPSLAHRGRRWLARRISPE